MGCMGEAESRSIGPEMSYTRGIKIGCEMEEMPCGREVRVEVEKARWRMIIWCRGGRCSLAACSRWSTQVTGRVGRGSSRVRRYYFDMCTYKTNRRSEDRRTIKYVRKYKI
jgi:hypothetical protein